MAFKMYSEVKEVRKEVFFKLFQEGEYIMLSMVDENGKQINCGNILSIDAQGRFEKSMCVNSTVGLELDGVGQIVIHN